MFGNASQPSLNYSFHAWEPTENLDLVRRQLLLANQYRNNLVAIELERRGQVEAALTELFPDLMALEKSLSEADAEVTTLLGVQKSANAAAKKLTTDPLAKARIKAAKEVRKGLYEQRKVARREAFQSLAWTTRQEHIEVAHKLRRIEARKHCNVYWGTYLTIENSLSDCRSGAPPRLERFAGEGSLAVQIQGGMSPAEAFGGEDTRLMIDPVAEYDEQGVALGRCQRSKTVVRLRIGSQGRTPIWCAVPVKLHRPLPADCRIKWVFLHCRRFGLRMEWSLRFVLSRESGWAREDLATGGAVALDVGWRVVPGGLRVAYWVGDDGQTGELVLPDHREANDWRHMLDKAQDLASIRDSRFNEMRDAFADWLVSVSTKQLPPSLTALTHLRLWKSKEKLGRAIEAAGADVRRIDSSLADRLAAWWTKERHLQRWELDNRRVWERRRLELYRDFAARLSRRYRSVVLEKLDLRKLQREKSVEDKTADDAAMKFHQRDAAISLLRQCLSERFAETVEESAVDTTRRCHACGSLESWDHAELTHTCGACGQTWDQDENSARNQLAAHVDSARAPVA